MSWEKSLLYFLSWSIIWFLQRETTKGQNFRVLTVQVKFRLTCTLTDSFGWKYLKFQPKKYRGVTYVSWYQRVVQNLKEKPIFVSKMTKIWWILIQVLKTLKNLKKNWLVMGKWHDKFGRFSSEHLKMSKLVLSWDPFVQSWKCMGWKYTEVICAWHWRMMKNLKRSWLAISKLT